MGSGIGAVLFFRLCSLFNLLLVSLACSYEKNPHREGENAVTASDALHMHRRQDKRTHLGNIGLGSHRHTLCVV